MPSRDILHRGTRNTASERLAQASDVDWHALFDSAIESADDESWSELIRSSYVQQCAKHNIAHILGALVAPSDSDERLKVVRFLRRARATELVANRAKG